MAPNGPKISRRLVAIPGFSFAGLHCGVKKTKAKDLALLYSDTLALVAGTFTTHPAAAAPVLYSRRVVRGGKAQAVIINSGNANACTGKGGKRATRMTAVRVARALKIPAARVLVCSTGVIGQPLPLENILTGVDQAASLLSAGAIRQAAEAILTTDQSIKAASVRDRAGGIRYRLCGFAKGAGMIEPHMEAPHATMLAFIMTDLALERRFARRVLSDAVTKSFNRISVDGDTSTNDTCLLLAGGRAANPPLKVASAGARAFAKNLTALLQDLALQMVEDGEGATKVVTITVRGARSDTEAKRLAYGIANSQLVRTSFFGGDANWGRIVAALGNSGWTRPLAKVSIAYGGVTVCRAGVSTGPAADAKATRQMKQSHFEVVIDYHSGRGTHQILSSDLSLDYVKINSNYRS